MKRKKLKTGLVTNTIAPYRLPIFEDVGSHPSIDLTVFFCTESRSFRNWSTEIDATSYRPVVLDPMSFGMFDVSPALSMNLHNGSYDCIITGTAFHIAPCALIASFVAGVTDTPLIAWNESITTGWVENEVEDRLSMVKTGGRRVVRKLTLEFHRHLFERSNHVVAFSEMASLYAQDRGVREQNITVAPQCMPTIDSIDRDPTEIERTLVSKDKQTILSLGQLTPRKGIDTLIRAVRSLQNDELELIVAGDGPLRNDLERYAENDGRISFVGYVSESQKQYLFQHSDLFVLPTRHDPWGLVVNEALACGTTAITTEAAGVKMILDDDLVVPVDDSAALAEAISNVLYDASEPPQPSPEFVVDSSIMSRPLRQACFAAVGLA